MILGLNDKGKFTSPLFSSLFEKRDLSVSKEDFVNTFRQSINDGDFNNIFDGFKKGSKYLKDLKEQVKGVKGGLKTLTDEQVGQYFDGIGNSVEKVGTKISGASAKLKSFGVGLLNSLASAGIGFGIQAVVSLINDFITAEDGLRERARKTSAEFKSTEDSIESYKQQISSLYDVIDDEKSSDQEVYDARSQLLDIQNSLIENYGKEAGAIDVVTDAINGQVEALDALTKRKWDRQQGDFDSLWTGEFGDISRSFQNWVMRNRTGAETNTEAVKRIMESYIGDIDVRFLSKEDVAALGKMVKEYGAKVSPDNNYLGELAVEFGNIDETIEAVSEIIDNFDKYGGSEKLKNQLSTMLSKANKDNDAYKDYYNENLLRENIFKDTAKTAVFNDIEEIREKYQKAFTEGNEEAKKSAIKELSDVFSNLNFEAPVNKFFKEMYPELAEEVSEWDFTVKLKPELEAFSEEGYTKEDILEMFETKGLQKGENVFNKIKQGLEEAGIVSKDDQNEIIKIIDLLVKWGILQDDITDKAAATNAEYAKRSASDAVDSLADVKKAVTSLSDLYGQVVEKAEGATNFGFADPDTLNSIEQAFTQLADSRDEVTKEQLSQALEEFENTLIMFPNDAAKAQEAIDKLVTSYINQHPVIKDLTEDTAEYAEATLKAMGIENAHEVVQSRLAASSKEISAAYSHLVDKINEYSDVLSDTSIDFNSEDVKAKMAEITEYVQKAFQSYDDNGNPIEDSLKISDSFVQDHRKQILAMAQGDKDAFIQIRNEIAKETLVARMEIETNISTDSIEAQANSLIDYISQLDGMNIEVGADVNSQEFIDGLNEIIRGSNLTAEQVQAAFASMGYEAKITNATGNYSYPVWVNDALGGGMPTSELAKIRAAQPKMATGTIEVPQVEIITKNGKSGGGGISAPAHYKPPTSSTKSSGGSGGSGGGGKGGSGGGGSSKDPTEKAADAMEDAADSVEDAAKTMAEAATEAFNEIKGVWDKWISDQQHNHQMTGYRKQLADLQGKSLNDKSIPYGNYWKLTLAELDGMAFSYNGMANSLTAQMNQALATGAIQAGSKEHQDMQAGIQQAYQNQFQAMVEYQELLAKREEDRTSIIERIADRFGKIVENLGKTVSRMFTWWNKNWAINKQITAVENERGKQEKLEKRYKKDAKRIGLPGKYVRAIKNDTLDVTKIKDGFLLERIQKYQDLYEKIRDCQEAQKDLYDQERELIKSKLSTIVEYFDTIQNYYDSISGRIDSALSLKDAAGRKRTFADLLKQYTASSDSFKNADEGLWTYQTGINKKDLTRSLEEIQEDLKVDEIYNSDFYKDLKARNDALNQKNEEYQDKLEEIQQLREDYADASSKAEKKQIKKEIAQAKKEAKKLKLTKGEKKTLANTNAMLEASSQVTGNVAMEDTYSSATYQNLLKKIGKLENKKKLSKKEKKKLQMYQDELEAISDGVLANDVNSFSKKFEQLWKLDHKSKGLTKAEAATKAALEKSLSNISDSFQNYIKNLGDELNNKLIAESNKEANLKANFEKIQAETEDIYAEKLEDLEDVSGTASVSALQANIDKWEDWLAKGKNSKGKKLTKKQKKEIQKKIDAAEKKKNVLEQVLKGNVQRASDIYDWLLKNRSKYNKGKLSKKDAAKWDRLTIELQGYMKDKTTAVDELLKEKEDALYENELDYETKEAELEKERNERLAKTFEDSKQAAEYALTNAKEMIDLLSGYIDHYKSVVELLKNTDLGRLEHYGILDILGLDSSADISELLKDQIYDGYEAASEKVYKLVKKGDILKQLIDAGENGDFESILMANADELDESEIQTIRDIIDTLNGTEYTEGEKHLAWVEEWEKQFNDLAEELLGATQEVQDFKDKLREDVLFKAVDNAIKSADRFKNVYSSIVGIVNEDWVIDNATGKLTQYGVFKAQALSNELAQAQKQVDAYAKKIDEIDNARETYATEEDYQNARAEAVQNYYSGLQNAYSIEQSIYDLMKKSQENEINALKKQIDLRKELLNKRKELYEYDKRHKESQKAVDELYSQLQALNDVETSEAKAQRAQIESQLKDAQDALNDLEQEHIFDLENEAYDKYLEKLQDILDNSNKSIEETFEHFASVVKELVDIASGADTSQAEKNILDLVMGTGRSIPDTNVPKETPSIGYNGQYSPITTSDYVSSIQSVQIDPDTLTSFLRTYDIQLGNIANALTKNIVPDLSAIKGDNSQTANISLHFDNLLEVQGNVDSTVISDLKKFSNDITDQTLSKMFNELKKAGFNVTQH